MCNSKNHSPSCTCGFGGYGHRGRRGPSYFSYTQPLVRTKSPKELFLERYPEFTLKGRVAACFVNPNATCPVCGERVFYYQNDNGSRVFFDDLGPPWPKHPCTDTQSILAPRGRTPSDPTFGIRSQADVTEIMKRQNDLGINIESDFMTKHGIARWPLARVVKRMKSGKHVFIIAKLLKQESATQIYFSCKALPSCCKKRFLIAICKRRISFIHPASLARVNITIKRYRGAKPFLDAMEGAEILV